MFTRMHWSWVGCTEAGKDAQNTGKYALKLCRMH